MKLIDFFAFIFAGLCYHQTASLTHKMPAGWGQLAGYAIGVEGTYPLFVVLLRRLKVPAEFIVMASAAYQVAFLLVGIGVSIGWFFDSVFHIERE